MGGGMVDHTEKLAFLYYASWWDCGGMKFKIGGINPNCCYCTKKEIWGTHSSNHSKSHPTRIPPMCWMFCHLVFHSICERWDLFKNYANYASYLDYSNCAIKQIMHIVQIMHTMKYANYTNYAIMH